MSKKILIPEGLIDPNQTTVIEIPYDVQKMETVVAKPYFEPNAEAAGIVHPAAYGEAPDYYYYDVYDRQFNSYPAMYDPNLNCIEEEDLQESVYEEDVVYTDYEQTKTALNTCFVNPTYKMQPEHHSVDHECAYKEDEAKLRKPSNGNLATKDIMHVLDTMDKQEFKNLHRNLQEFQRARRKLFLETTSLNSLDDISTNLLESFK